MARLAAFAAADEATHRASLATWSWQPPTAGTRGRLAANDQLRKMVEWLRFPLEHPEVHWQPAG